MDFEALARDFLITIRGRRSQTALSRRLGYKTNVLYTWESGRRWPTAAEALRACQLCRIDVAQALTDFFGAPPDWVGPDCLPWSRASVAALLGQLRGRVTVTELARQAGLGRSSLSRWLSAEAEPRLPELFQLVEVSSNRLLDLIASFVDPARLPSAAPRWETLQARRRGAGELPWTQAVLRALELTDYAALPRHEPGWIARRLGIPEEEEQRCVDFLSTHGLLRWDGAHYQVEALSVDTRPMPEVGRQLRLHWSRLASGAIEAGAEGQFSYNVFAVSAADYARIREAHLAYFRMLRSIVAASKPGEVVAVANVQLWPLGRRPLG